MHVSMFLLVLALSCFSVHSDKYCAKDSDCYPRGGNGNFVWWQCCNRICHVFSRTQNSCPCYGRYKCPRGETCGSKWLCERYTPTEAPTVTTTQRYTTKEWTPLVITKYKSCTSDSDCRDDQECFDSVETDGPLCMPKSEDLTYYRLLHIGLPIGLPILLMPLFGYCGYKAKMWEERRRLRCYGTGGPYSQPAHPPQNSRTRSTRQPTTSRATELQSVSTASSHHDRAVIEVERPPPTAPQLSTASSRNDHAVIEMERPPPTAPQLPLPQNLPTDEAMEPRGADQQAGIAVSSSAAVIGHSSGSLLPGAPPSYEEIRRVQNGEVVEQPPPSYEEAVENYNQDTLI